MSRIFFRLELGEHARLGPGKVRLLELIAEHGSITAAGREMDMSYRRAWLLVDSLNRSFRRPVVATRLGGIAGNRAEVTPFGRDLIRRYREMEIQARASVAAHVGFLEAELAKDGSLPIVRDPRLRAKRR